MSRARIRVERAGEHYPGRGGWEWSINDPATVVGWGPSRFRAWWRARAARSRPDLYPVRPSPPSDDVQTRSA